MAVLGLREAAQAVGVTRQHLYRLANKGRVSLTERPDGSKGVDTSELLRAFGRLEAPTDDQATGDSRPGSRMRHEATPPATAVQVAMLEGELTAARNALKVAEERLGEAKERESKLLELLSSQARLLEHHQAQPAPQAAPTPAAVEAPKPKRAKPKDKAKPDKAAPKRSDKDKPRKLGKMGKGKR